MCASRAEKKAPRKRRICVVRNTKNVFFEKNTNSKKNPEKSRQIGGFCIWIRVAKISPFFWLIVRNQRLPVGTFIFLFWILGFCIGIPFLEWTFFLSAFGFCIGNLKISIVSGALTVRKCWWHIRDFFFARNRWKLYRNSISKEGFQVDLHILSWDRGGGQEKRQIGPEFEGELVLWLWWRTW